ncbi:MAG: adventurous gliding motility protein CglE [Deltaproteobacteria bacterium]|nr:adventurous gliding motility protein CglE [Deltaproteobacteria bacterium]
MNRAQIALLAAALAILAPAGALAGTPAAGVAQEIRSGFFADVNLGGFFTATGANSRGGKGVSNAQAYLQLGVGYDVLSFLSLGLHFGLGSSAASCFASQSKSYDCVFDATKTNPASDPSNLAPDNFTVTTVGAEGVFKVPLLDRLFLRPRVDAGYAFLDPQPIRKNDGSLISGGAYVGVGVGVEYATHMDHFSIGFDVEGKLIIGPNIPAFAFYPMIKYTF